MMLKQRNVWEMETNDTLNMDSSSVETCQREGQQNKAERPSDMDHATRVMCTVVRTVMSGTN